MVVCVECLPADKPWDVVSATRRSSGVAPRACVRVYVRVCWCRRIFTYIHTNYIYFYKCIDGSEGSFRHVCPRLGHTDATEGAPGGIKKWA